MIECLLDAGRRVRFDHALVVGTSPAPPRQLVHAEIVRLDDPTRTVARTHVAIVSAGADVWVMDLSCGHGTSVVLPSGATVPVHPGSSLSVPAGAVVHFGARSLQITAIELAHPRPAHTTGFGSPIDQRTTAWRTKRVSSNSL